LWGLRPAYEEVEVDLPARAHRRPEFRRLNPFAQVPATASRYAVIEPSKRSGTSIAFLIDPSMKRGGLLDAAAAG